MGYLIRMASACAPLDVSPDIPGPRRNTYLMLIGAAGAGPRRNIRASRDIYCVSHASRQLAATNGRSAVRIETFARIYGVVFLIVGIVGFIPGLTPAHDHPGLMVEAGSGMALGLFPVNALHNIVHLLFGVWGLLGAGSFKAARTYARAVAIAYALLTVMGLIPATSTTFGLVPIYGHDVWLHALLAAIAAYFGFAYRETSAAAGRTSSATR